VCTLAFAWGVFPDAPVVAAANRDEATARPSEPPGRRTTPLADGTLTGDADGAARTVVAPRDAHAGGTWVGVNDAGVYVTVTNRWLDDEPPAERSRGLLVADCLACGSAEAAARHVERAVREHDYAGFNLVVADGSAAVLLEWDGSLAATTLAPGVHVAVNVGGVIDGGGRFRIPAARADRGERQAANARRLADRLQPEPGEDADAWLDRAGAALGDHDLGVCVHGDGYGTRSASLVRVPADGPDRLAATRFDYADGPPCETPFEPVGR